MSRKLFRDYHKVHKSGRFYNRAVSDGCGSFISSSMRKARSIPARVISHFTEEEEHKQVAALFHTKIQELTTKEEQEKALKETIIKVKDASLERKMRELPPTDLAGFQRMMKERKAVEELRKLHISID